jgi:hypothetical protein
VFISGKKSKANQNIDRTASTRSDHLNVQRNKDDTSMISKVYFCAFFAVMCLATNPLTFAEDVIDYQKVANGARWGWQVAMSHPLGCISQCGNKYDLTLQSKNDDRFALTISVHLEGIKIYSWDGHMNSVFRILDDRLYYANFHPSSSGGTVIAVDLKTGKELWTSSLNALGDISHSAYRTLLNIDCSNDVVTIFGNESMGQYFEIKRTDTGATVGHKIFEKSETDNVLLSIRANMDKFFDACESGDLARVKELAVAGLDPRGRHADVFYDHRRRGALHYAATNGDADIIQYLLDSGCDPNSKDKNGVTPLHLAVSTSGALERLLAAKADPNIAEQSGRNPLHYAAQEASSDSAKILLEHGAKVDSADNLGFTPLHVAAEYGSTDVVEVLIKAGAKPMTKNTHGETPLDWAQSRKHPDIVQKLQEAVEQ